MRGVLDKLIGLGFLTGAGVGIYFIGMALLGLVLAWFGIPVMIVKAVFERRDLRYYIEGGDPRAEGLAFLVCVVMGNLLYIGTLYLWFDFPPPNTPWWGILLPGTLIGVFAGYVFGGL